MTHFAHGLVIGKFYPPHHGHHALIRNAAAEADRVTVVAMASLGESIPLTDRVEWLRAEHCDDLGVSVVGVRCDAPLDVHDEQVWTAQVAVIRTAIRQLTDSPVDAVFSGETYGDELARRLNAKHVAVERSESETSGTAIRANLVTGWSSLSPATRAGLVTRVIVVGAESTGTTTVSQLLADHYRSRTGAWRHTQWVGEYGRDYSLEKWQQECATASATARSGPTLDEISWHTEDFDAVATEQTKREELAARESSPLLICDTDAFATAVWERRYLGAAGRTGQHWARPPLLPRRDLYLITDHVGVPWYDDGLREGDLQIREAMTAWFIDGLTAAGHSWVLLTGTLEQRVALGVRTIDQLLAVRMSFAPALTGPGFESTVT
jgi:HTH-type transcriptional regulator, transcriptional repressor of NAD biosynthesis genes